MPKSWTNALIATIPKSNQISSFKDLRPISLCNYCNKVINKLLAIRLSHIFPSIISDNQGAFTKGRIIQDNLLLAHELLNHIRKKVNGSNLVVKLDIAKAFDRVSCKFSIKVVRKFGFAESFIHMI